MSDSEQVREDLMLHPLCNNVSPIFLIIRKKRRLCCYLTIAPGLYVNFFFDRDLFIYFFFLSLCVCVCLDLNYNSQDWWRWQMVHDHFKMHMKWMAKIFVKCSSFIFRRLWDTNYTFTTFQLSATSPQDAVGSYRHTGHLKGHTVVWLCIHIKRGDSE